MLGRLVRLTLSTLAKTPEEVFARHQSEVSKVADRFNFMNDAMTFRMHRLWKIELADMLGTMYAGKPLHFLDLCAASGDVACKLTDKMRAEMKEMYLKQAPFTVSMVDCNPDMIRVCKARMIAEDYPFAGITEARAEDLPFEKDTFDAVVCSFGFRSIVDKAKALDEAMRVLKPGGRLLTLEFGKVENPILNFAYSAYKRAIIPALGQFYENNYDSYEFFANSIDSFYTAEEWKTHLSQAGFSLVTHKDLMGGIVMVHSGVKLLE